MSSSASNCCYPAGIFLLVLPQRKASIDPTGSSCVNSTLSSVVTIWFGDHMESTKFAHGVEESVLPKVSVLPRRHAQMGWEYRIPSLPIPWPKMSPQNCTVSSCSAWSGCQPGFLYPHVVSEIRIVFPLMPLTPKHFVVPSRLMSVYSNG